MLMNMYQTFNAPCSRHVNRSLSRRPLGGSVLRRRAIKVTAFACFLVAFCAALPPTLSPVSSIDQTRISLLLRSACPMVGEASLEQLINPILSATAVHGVEPTLLVSIIARESGCRSAAKSPKGAIGIMQLMPKTAQWLGVSNPSDSFQNIAGGAKYMAKLLTEFDGNLSLALAAYNAGPNAVRRYGRIPPYRETRNYVVAVLKTYAKLSTSSKV